MKNTKTNEQNEPRIDNSSFQSNEQILEKYNTTRDMEGDIERLMNQLLMSI